MITTSGTTRDNTLAAMLGGTLILAGFTAMMRPRLFLPTYQCTKRSILKPPPSS